MNHKEQAWRLIEDPPQTGAWNMAVDEAILAAVAAGEAPPTLRMYAWQPACLSIGYGQRYRDIDAAGLRSHGWDVVRRPTGGRAILHTDELTYSVCAPANHPIMQGGILPSYQLISGALLRGLELLAVPATREAHYDLDPDIDPRGPVCFEIPSNWEITFEGRKLIGSAQVRRSGGDTGAGGVLQHGTLPLRGDLRRITQALAFTDENARQEAAERLIQRAVTVEEALGRRVSWEEAAHSICRGFEAALGLNFARSTISGSETAHAEQLLSEKFGSPAWTRRRA